MSAVLLPVVAGGVMLLSRSLDKSNSGNGAGIVGAPTGEAPAQIAPEPSLPDTAINSTLSLLLTNAAALDKPRQLALLAAAGTHLTDQSGDAAKTIRATQQLDQAALLDGIKAKSAEAAAPSAPEKSTPDPVASIFGATATDAETDPNLAKQAEVPAAGGLPA